MKFPVFMIRGSRISLISLELEGLLAHFGLDLCLRSVSIDFALWIPFSPQKKAHGFAKAPQQCNHFVHSLNSLFLLTDCFLKLIASDRWMSYEHLWLGKKSNNPVMLFFLHLVRHRFQCCCTLTSWPFHFHSPVSHTTLNRMGDSYLQIAGIIFHN